MNQKTFEHLKVGDRVALCNEKPYRVCKVEKVTRTQIAVNNERYYRNTGNIVGRWLRYWLSDLPEDLAAAEAAERERAAQDVARRNARDRQAQIEASSHYKAAGVLWERLAIDHDISMHTIYERCSEEQIQDAIEALK